MCLNGDEMQLAPSMPQMSGESVPQHTVTPLPASEMTVLDL